MYKPSIFRSVTYHQYQILDAIDTICNGMIVNDIDHIKGIVTGYIADDALLDLTASINQLVSLGILKRVIGDVDNRAGGIQCLRIDHNWRPYQAMANDMDTMARDMLISEYQINLDNDKERDKLDRLMSIINKIVADSH